MSKKYTSRATKAVLASLLAASMVMPSIASAQVTSSVSETSNNTAVTTTLVETKSIAVSTLADGIYNVKMDMLKEDKSGSSSAGRNFSKDAILTVKDGKGTVELFVSSNFQMIKGYQATVEGVLANAEVASYTEDNYIKSIKVPVENLGEAVPGVITVDYSSVAPTMGITPHNIFLQIDLPEEVTPEVTPEPTPEVTPEVTPEPTPEEVTPVITVGSLPDGMYNVKMQILKEDKSGPSGAGNNFSKDAILKVVDGKGTLDLYVTSNNKMVVGFESEVNGELKEAAFTGLTKDNYTKIISIPVTTLGEALPGTVDVDMTAYTGKVVTYPIFVQVDPATIATTGSIYTYKPGTNEGSIMNVTYLNAATSYKAVKEGYEVTVTFPKGKYIVDFKVEGKDAEVVQKETATNPVAVYKFIAPDISGRIPATIHINVNEPAVGVVYNENHSIEFELTGKVAQPFGDIEKSWAKSYISELYAKDIFKSSNKFNPTNKTERYQFALMLQRALKLEVPATTTFTDIQKYDAETVDAVKALSNFGVINGKDAAKTTFDPKGQISRQDTAIMINRLLAKYGYVAKEDATVTYTDVKDATKGTAYEKEAYSAIAQLNSLGIMTGKENNKFDPKGTLTRQEMAKVLTITLEVLQGLKK